MLAVRGLSDRGGEGRGGGERRERRKNVGGRRRAVDEEN